MTRVQAGRARARELARKVSPQKAAAAAGAAAAAVIYTTTGWGWYYLTVLALAVIPEIYWVIVNSANTISHQIWGLEGLDLAHPLDFAAWSPWHWAIAFALWLLFGWLSLHLPFGWLR